MGSIANVIRKELMWKGVRNLSSGSAKFQQAAVALDEIGDESIKWENAKPFGSIPGPGASIFPNFSNFWTLIKPGSKNKLDIMKLYMDLRKEYGDMARMPSLGRPDLVILFNPVLIEKMFRNESVWPRREGLECFEYYQERIRPEMYGNMKGIPLLQGKEWQDARSIANPVMMQPRKAKLYTEPTVTIANDFIERMRKIRDKQMEMPSDFANELNKWSLESIGYIALDTRLGALRDDLDKNSKTQKMISSVVVMFETTYHLELLPPIWKYVSTPKWRTFVNAMNTITDFTYGCVMERVKMLENEKDGGNNESKSVLEELLKSKNPRFALIMAMDMLAAGVDTTSNAVATILSLLATNPDKQEKLYEELRKYLPEKESNPTSEILNELKYLKATVKEALRMYPVVLANSRTTVKDMVFAGYQIPQGSRLISLHYTICQDEKYFPEPKKFIPERWLKSDAKSTAHPFAYLPFGFGPRMCIGRRFAELEMEVIVTKIIRNFRLSYQYGDMEWSTVLFTKPSKPLKFRVEDREK